MTRREGRGAFVIIGMRLNSCFLFVVCLLLFVVYFLCSMIGFAGPRVIRETTHQNLPDGFQTAEFLCQHGLVDKIVHRKQLRDTLATLLGYLVPV